MFTLGAVQPHFVVPVGHLAAAWNTLRSATHNAAKANPARVPHHSASSAVDDFSRVNAHELAKGVKDAMCDLGFSSLSRDIHIDTLNSVLYPESKLVLRKQNLISRHNESFFFNKHGFAESELHGVSFTQPSHLRVTLLRNVLGSHYRSAITRSSSSHTSPYAQQVRGFKTRRAVTKGFGKSHDEESSRVKDFFKGSVLGSINLSKQDSPKSDRVRGLLDAQSDPNAQEKIKLSFAEGYMAGQDVNPKGTTSESWSKRLYKFVAMVVIIFAVYYIAFPLFVALYSKSTRLNNIFADSGSLVKAEEVDERFEDVKGADEVKEELCDVVEFLRNPDKFTALGAKLPKGVLLCGPPGIGKTLLARAVAGEAGVPFIYASGSEFDEIFVGVGAKKIRDLFNDAKNRAPCVIFLDEIDAVGSKRVNSETHPYANQTINQLLTEMDGFKQNEGIIVLGATNRRDNLDKALMRPGRFDMEVHMQPPDYKGRMDIFELYLNKIKAAVDIDVARLARATSGYTGADIANVVNQAAIRAALTNSSAVTMADLEFARDKITMGPMKKTRIPDEETNKVTAYHEAGHALVAYYTKDATSPHKVTIMPRGQSLGHTAFIPEKDQYNMTKVQLLAEMDVALGGRVAEELMFGSDKITTGASSDFQKANAIAESLVKKLGMSEKAGFRIIEDKDFLHGSNPEYSSATMEIVDTEIKRLLNESYERCRVVLKAHQSELKKLSDALLVYETLDRDEIKLVLEGKKLVKKTPMKSVDSPKSLVPQNASNKKAIQAIIEGTKLPSKPHGGNPSNTAARTEENTKS